ncbi:hypothetical protein GCM10011386_09810 [Parapedobacter defluvii]|uniref:Haloacid dehalogenase-like hydrolase n=1 Tax=Parapedobacter defluvii TaxID=2045106 RepID=A0ABQ1LBK2_9SPHI|nr:HAD family hydrolase [Parapedobacter defluvii]GGC19970.1 hypothetical protein GCM10011386_09810 [Parapedobacter defluvii]
MRTDVNIYQKRALVIGLDDVLFPKKDYLLQVYYLFANLLEYTETVPPAKDLTEFLKSAYMHHGEDRLFERGAEVFGIDNKYQAQFDRLHFTAKLPLKLLLYESVRDIMRAAHENGKPLFILTGGNPAMQLNKLRHVEWEGLDRVIKVYFEEELAGQQKEPMTFLLAENGLESEDVLYIHAPGDDRLARIAGVDSVDVERILTDDK